MGKGVLRGQNAHIGVHPSTFKRNKRFPKSTLSVVWLGQGTGQLSWISISLVGEGRDNALAQVVNFTLQRFSAARMA